MEPDLLSYKTLDPENILDAAECLKKQKYLIATLLEPEQSLNFTSYVVIMDGIVGTEANILFSLFSTKAAPKLSKPHSQICGMHSHCHQGYCTHLYLRGFRIPAARMSNPPLMEEISGIGVMHWYKLQNLPFAFSHLADLNFKYEMKMHKTSLFLFGFRIAFTSSSFPTPSLRDTARASCTDGIWYSTVLLLVGHVVRTW
jgi:hypothetical protein